MCVRGMDVLDQNKQTVAGVDQNVQTLDVVNLSAQTLAVHWSWTQHARTRDDRAAAQSGVAASNAQHTSADLSSVGELGLSLAEVAAGKCGQGRGGGESMSEPLMAEPEQHDEGKVNNARARTKVDGHDEAWHSEWGGEAA